MSSQELDEFNKRVPVDDVWLHSYYPTQKMSLREAIIKHREYAVPEMLDNQDGLVMMWTEIDMLKKKVRILLNTKCNVLCVQIMDMFIELNYLLYLF